MLFEITFGSSPFLAEGLIQKNINPTKVLLYASQLPDREPTDIEDALSMEFSQLIEVDFESRTVSFARDYLGSYPLLYASYSNTLIISDEISKIIHFLRMKGVKLKLSEQALALYFSLGYVPQGMTLFTDIFTAENAAIYTWNESHIVKNDKFQMIEVDPSADIHDLSTYLDEGIKAYSLPDSAVDVWCSGGLDSSISALSMLKSNKCSRLLTMGYPQSIINACGMGEIRYSKMLSEYLGVPHSTFTLSKIIYQEYHQQMLQTHYSPIIDTCVVPKYVLASQTKGFAVTGEGGDPLFAGVKNNFISYLQSVNLNISLGHMYAISHKRFFQLLPQIFKFGKELQDYVITYLDEQLSRYETDLINKLFYTNTFLKQGSLIFSQNYYAAKTSKVKVFHPLTSLPMYRFAFSLPTQFKYLFPRGKLALIENFKSKLPTSIIKRKKSGTILPMEYYFEYLLNKSEGHLDPLDVLSHHDFFNDKPAAMFDLDKPLLSYAFLTLSRWLDHHSYQEV